MEYRKLSLLLIDPKFSMPFHSMVYFRGSLWPINDSLTDPYYSYFECVPLSAPLELTAYAAIQLFVAFPSVHHLFVRPLLTAVAIAASYYLNSVRMPTPNEPKQQKGKKKKTIEFVIHFNGM